MEHKTNTMRELDKLKIKYNFYSYVGTDAVSGVEVAKVLNQNPEKISDIHLHYGNVIACIDLDNICSLGQGG